MPVPRDIVLHVVDGPFPGAVSNCVRQLRRDLQGMFHVVADISHERPDGWSDAASSWQWRVDSFSSSPADGSPCRHGVDPASVRWVFLHDVPYRKFAESTGLDVDPARIVEWDYGSISDSGETTTPCMSACCSPGACDPTWPLVDCSRLMCVAGKSTSPTVGVLFDPVRDPDMSEVASALSLSPERPRVLLSGRGEFPHGVARCGWTWNSPWSNASTCLSAVAPVGRTYPYALVASMATGRPCVAFMCGDFYDLGGLVRDGATCLVSSDPFDASEKAIWLARHDDAARAMGARAIYASMAHDRDPNLLKLRGLLI